MYEMENADLAAKYRSGANWFFWIAGLTIVTSIMTFTGADWRFLISLGTTQVIDALANVMSAELGGAPKIVALILDLVLTGVFVVFGVLANKKFLWAYILGMAIFVIDGFVSLLVQDWVGVIAHVVVLIFMVPGFMAGRKLVEIEQMMAQSQAAATSI
jgi:hypothetical protein